MTFVTKSNKKASCRIIFSQEVLYMFFPDVPPTNIVVVLVLGVATRIMMMVDTAMVTGYPYGICGIFGE